MTTRSPLQDTAWLRAQVNAGLTNAQIAHLADCTKPAVASALARQRILRRRRIPVRVRPHTACQYCGRTIRGSNMARHEVHCEHNPVVLDLTRNLLDGGDGVIVSSTHYRRVSAGTLAISAVRLRELHGTWGEVAKQFGLLHGQAAVVRQIEMGVANEAAAVRYERRILEQEAHRGFQVCSVRIVGHEQWCMLR